MATIARTPAKRQRGLIRGHGTPLYRQIYERFRQAIATGQLRPGDRLPSVRDLAREFATARGTVDAAFAMLAGEGYVLSRGPQGTIVSPDLNTAAATAPGHRSIASRTRPQAHAEPRLLQLGLPALDLFPRKAWAHTVAREVRRISPADMTYPDPAGLQPLRQEVAAYLASSRGIVCQWQQIVITGGFQDGLDLALRLLLRRNDRAWIEDPYFPPVRAALDMAGARLAPVRVDADGIRVTDGIGQARKARIVVVTPSHQSPLGTALSLPRRLSLLGWANSADAYVIEDDYDSEFRFVGRPLPALKSLDREQRVIYAGSFSKTLFPGLRLGYLVLPDRLLGQFVEASATRTAGHDLFKQRIVAAFMAEGQFARHLKRMRKLYAARRAALVDALEVEFGEQIMIALKPGGMHLVVQFTAGPRDVALAELAKAAGFGVEALSARTIAHRSVDALLIGFTNVAEQDAPAVARRLRHALQPGLKARPDG
ncbi:PLP-dependent aminotransferase family protein [Bradyrhizobium sp. CCBAU 53421]|uniref:MocR-like pyridoxine biosynthesis transcription factor PdxR n=1 Tax=Bradyrhizobium sp. CCBAU 53421 TaxID=1325120 RepID=UPI001889CB3D|nr:PLP-dependent aminotransferase family protein [Bradyrhizobium sp. CCBAU 53421]QOZ36878.1 PLP-dependent aminotransferase family protein [Bradyrhizobium sp. CCBAU 53421]